MSKNINELNKESRIVLFLKENFKNKSKEEIEDLYLKKYKLNEKSNSLNLRVIERFLGVYSKYNPKEKEIKVKSLKESLVKVNIDYKDLIKSYLEIKEKVKRSNRTSNFKDLVIEL